MAGTTRLVLDYLQFTTFVLRFGFSYEKQHSVKLLTGTWLDLTSFGRRTCQNPPNSLFTLLATIVTKLKSGRKTYRFLIRERRGSNSRPHAWQACALTKLSYAPITGHFFIIFAEFFFARVLLKFLYYVIIFDLEVFLWMFWKLITASGGGRWPALSVYISGSFNYTWYYRCCFSINDAFFN